MANVTKDRESYNTDAAHVRRLQEALSKDKSMDPQVREVLVVTCQMIYQTLLSMDDLPYTKERLKSRHEQLTALIEKIQ